MVRLYSCLAASLEEDLQPLVPECLNHGLSYSVAFRLSIRTYYSQSRLRLSEVELDTCLLQYPRFNLNVPQVQQVEFPLDVVLFSNGAWLVSHNLRNDSGRNFHPLRQRAKGTTQPMQG